MPPFTVRMSGNLVFLVYPHDRPCHLVKVGVQGDLQNEFVGLAAGHAAFPNGVPRPLLLVRRRSFPVLVTTGIEFEPLGAQTLASPPRALRDQLAGFFAVAARAFHTDVAIAHSVRVSTALDRLASPLPADAWSRYVEAVAADLDSLPGIRQHGDFYADNLGLRNGTLVVLDWEDFGRDCLPGLDVAQLLLSANEFDVSSIVERTRVNGPHAWIVEAAREAIPLARPLLLRLLPAYIALIARMKADFGYGAAFTARALRALPEALAVAARASP